MKKQLLKKTYTCLQLVIVIIVTAMLFAASANAQIVYTDVNPDSTMYCNVNCTLNYYLDLNNDANNDFIIIANRSGSLGGTSQASVSTLNGNAVKDTLVTTHNVSIPLQFNAVIDSNLLLQQSWQTSGLNAMSYLIGIPGSQGIWNNLSDYYLGLRLLQSGQTYYGWVRLRVDVTSSYASFMVRDYAYNSIPDQAIFAGQPTATGITENPFASSINLFPNPTTNHLTIALGNNNKKVEVTIADITGKVIYTTIATDTQKVEVNTQDFAIGVYVVQIQSTDFMATKKLVIKK